MPALAYGIQCRPEILESAGVIAQHILEDLTQAEELLKDDPLNYKNDLNNPFTGLRKLE